MTRSLRGALLLALLIPLAARAQGDDSRVVPRGWLEVRALGLYTQYDSRFGEGGRQELGSGFAGELQTVADRVLGPLLTPLRSNLGSFFTQTAGQVDAPVTPDEVGSGSVVAALAGDIRRVPVSLGYGLTPRLTLTATLAVESSKLAVNGLRFSGSSVGLNPNPTANAEVLSGIDPAYAALGQATLLPTRGSAAGAELQRRVRALAEGDTLQLPVRALGVAELASNTTLRAQLSNEEAAAIGLRGARASYGPADVEVGARLRLLGPPAGNAPDSAARGLRSTLALAARLPTGSQGDTTFILALDREVGSAGFSAQLFNDLLLSRRFWATASAGYTQLLGADVFRRDFSDARPFPGDSVATRRYRREPGSRVYFALMPRFRLSRELGFAAAYRFEHGGATTFSAADSGGGVKLGPLERTEGWSAHSVGVGGSYSTYEAYREGKALYPLEVGLIYRNSVAGSGFAPHAGSVEFSLRFLYQLRGRPRRVVADTTAAPPPAPPPPPPARPPVTPAVP